MNAVIRRIEESQVIRKNVPFRVGDTVKVSLRIKEGEKERIQNYEGIVTGIQGAGAKMRFTVRKISYGVGVEKTFYFQSPMIKDVKAVRSGKVRRAKLFYLRAKVSKKDTRIQEGKKPLSVPSEGAAEPSQEASLEVPAPTEAPASEAPAPKPAKAEKKEKAAEPKAKKEEAKPEKA
jgi:large subunit ribosomal protein L19